jgi:[protein-PII] uridylyltransferase
VLRRLLGDGRGVAVVALGGYARRELCPGSDIDILLLHDGWGRSDLESVVQQLVYPLWDAGLTVGHAVRTPSEAVSAGGERIDTATALLDRRLVAGDAGLNDALSSRVDRWAHRNRRRLISELAAADAARHASAGAYPGRLEPDLKNGAGGLRDLHSLRWAGGWALGDSSLDALVAARYVGARDRHQLAEANDTLLRVRCALHLSQPSARGKAVDVLRLDSQDEVAQRLGLLRDDGAGDGDALLRQVGLSARTVAHVHGRSWPLLLSDVGTARRRWRRAGSAVANGIALEDGMISAVAPPDPSDTSWPLRVVATAAQHHAHLTRATATALSEQSAATGQRSWNAAAREALLDILRSPAGCVVALQDADHLGVIQSYLPEWGRVRGRPQRNPLHMFDLDTHGAQAVQALHLLVENPDLEWLWRALPRRDELLLAVWLHDVGKAFEGDHSAVGAEVARRWLSHMGFAAPLAERVAHLVRWHLLLPDVATRRDLDDDAEIAGVADIVGDVATLDALYLLSLADGRATGPAAWSAWKDSLMGRLHAAVRAVLGAPMLRPTRHHEPAGAQAGEHDRAVVQRVAPSRYLDVAPSDQIAAHAALLHDPLVPGELRAAVRRGSVPGTAVLSVAATDRLGLVADCAGVLAAHDLDVLEARAFTGPTGVALDWFTVTGDPSPAAVVEDLCAVGRGDADVPRLLARRRRMSARSGDDEVLVTIRDRATVEVRAADAPALLYRLCRALADEQLSVRSARVSSLGDTVLDVFEVAPAVGDERVREIKSALISAAQLQN